MTDILIKPGRPLRGEVVLPGDKSISHRAALLAALAEGESRIQNFLSAGVTAPMLEALTALGVGWELEVSGDVAGDDRRTAEGFNTSGTLLVAGRGFDGLQPPLSAG